MESKAIALLLVSLVLAVFLIMCNCQSEGDVRLVGGTRTPIHTGRLDIFWKGKWGTFCELSKKGGDAACRQLGYSEAEVVERYYSTLENIPWASDDMPIAMGSASCDYSELHVLRCDYSTDTSACSHERDIVLQCSPTGIWNENLYSYNTQLRIVSDTYSSTGTLEIRVNEQWGNICYSHFDQGAADSACRQLGYTNAASFSPTNNKSSSIVWLSKTQCGSRSCNCLSRCFDKPNAPTSCPDSEYLSIQCTFDASTASQLTSGGKFTCEFDSSSSCTGDTQDELLSTLTQSIILPVILPIAIVLLCFILTCCTIAIAAFVMVRRQLHCRCCCRRRHRRNNFILHPDDL